MVADNRGNIDIQPAVVGFHQQIAQTVRLFRHQNHHPASACRIQFADGAFRQGAVEIGQQSSVVKNAFQFGAHKETTGTVVNKLIVLHNVEFMLVADIGDTRDEAFLIRANSA